MTQPSQFSPAAEAILAAARRHCPCEPAPEIAAAVARALAKAVVPAEGCPPQDQFDGFADWDRATERWSQRSTIRNKIRAIARELEGWR